MTPSPTLEAPAVDAKQAAIARLVATRGKLKALWIPESMSGPRHSGSANPGRFSRRLRAMWRHWRVQLADTPIAGLALNAVDRWWQSNPWRVAGETVADELQHAVSPWVRRHPVIAVALAAAAGGALAAARPWSWPLVMQHLKPLPAQVGRWALAQLGQAPLQSLILGALLAGGTAARSAASADDPQGEPQSDPQAEPHGPPAPASATAPAPAPASAPAGDRP